MLHSIFREKKLVYKKMDGNYINMTSGMSTIDYDHQQFYIITNMCFRKNLRKKLLKKFKVNECEKIPNKKDER